MFRSCQIIIRELCSLLNLYYSVSQFNWYLQTRCCGSKSCCVGMCCGAVAGVLHMLSNERLVCKYQLNCEFYNITLARN